MDPLESGKGGESETENFTYICEECGKRLQSKASLLSHLKWKHETENPNHVCDVCNKTFTKKSNLNRHRSTCTIKNKQTNIFKSKCAVCDFRAVNNPIVEEHYRNEHNVDLVHKHLEFKTLQEFVHWKEKFESDTKSQFVQNCGSQIKNNGVLLTKYVCHRDGYFRSKSKNIRNTKILGSNKINCHCPAKIYLYESEECVKVDYVDKHMGHELELERMSISSSERAVIAEKLSLKIPFQQVLNEIRDSVTNNELQRIHLLTKKDLWNIAGAYKLDREDVLDQDYYASVDAWVSHMQSSSTIVRLYKPLDEILANCPQLEQQDFFLIIMNDAQLEILQNFGSNCICVDKTYVIKSSGYQLYTIMVLDNMHQSFPCAFLFTNREDTLAMELFFKTIKLCLNCAIIPNTFMSEVDDSFYTAWSAVMGPVKHRLFCSWQVDRAWRKSLNKINTKEKRDKIYKKLKLLMFETDTQIFDAMSDNLFDELVADPDSKEFAKYFEEYKNSSATWAYSFPKNYEINSNENWENMHKIIEHFYFDGTQVKRIDTTIEMLMKFIRDRLFDKLIILNKKKVTHKLQDLRLKHEKSLTLSGSTILENEDFWCVLFSDNKEIYEIERNKNNCKCQLLCIECETCLHDFTCSCIDSSIEWNMCEHIHQICMFLKTKNTSFSKETICKEGTTSNSINRQTSAGIHSPSKNITIVNKISEKSDDTWEKRKINVLQTFLETLNNVKNEEQLQAVAEYIAPLESIVTGLADEEILVCYTEPPSKKIRS